MGIDGARFDLAALKRNGLRRRERRWLNEVAHRREPLVSARQWGHVVKGQLWARLAVTSAEAQGTCVMIS
jgi:hypothetical protein